MAYAHPGETSRRHSSPEMKATLGEEEALQWAVDECLRNRHQLRRGGYVQEYVERCVELLRDGGELALRAAAIPWCGDEDEVSDLVRSSRDGDETAHRFLLELAAARIEQAQSLSRPLKEFVIEFLRDPKKSNSARVGRKRSDFARDFFIFYAIFQIKTKWEFPATRNEATRSASAASITQKALEKVGIHLTEAAVTKIWNCKKKSLSIE